MTAFDAVVVGGGIAGLSAALALSASRRVLLLEREPLLAAHASGRNAAIFRPLEHDATTGALARRSLARFAELSDEPLLRRCGVLLAAASPVALEPLLAHARVHAVECELLTGAALYARAPVLAGGEIAAALWLPQGGVLDIHALTSALAARVRSAGAIVQVGSGVARVRVQRPSVSTGAGAGARVEGVELDDGTAVSSDVVVLAAGAWGEQLGADAGAALPLTPLRRHLVQLEPGSATTAGMSPEQPVVWRIDGEHELYFRPESGGVLCSPCDAQAWAPGVPSSDPAALELLAGKLARSAPGLAGARVRRAWACLRTFAPDGELVVGPDPRIAGLGWLAGLGGRGMGVALGAGELLAEMLDAAPEPSLAAAVTPARWL
ncbi:MAG TPA: FAD-dependent oxidoreductase [Polyangiales bacterium]|nr:FAD-dependent oxidoreductase [Polyangiales bacterium]